MPNPQPTPAERVTTALQRAHWRAHLAARDTGEALERVTLQHRAAVHAHADALAEVRALAGALTERDAPTLLAVEEQQQAETRARLSAGLTLSGPIVTGRLADVATLPGHLQAASPYRDAIARAATRPGQA